MSLSAFLAFAGIYSVAVLMPGPGVAAVVARALATGARRTFPFIIGMVIGDLVWLLFAAFGLAALAQTLHGLFVTLKYAGAAYLLFMAWKLWTTKSAELRQTQSQSGEGLRLVASGLSMTLGNPKTMIFFLAILPQVLDLGGLGAATFVELAMAMSAILTVAMSAYALLAARARLMIRDANSMRTVNRGSALIMAGVAGAVAAG
jgi:threonine/homoserine/homoserine lactone efflux protein